MDARLTNTLAVGTATSVDSLPDQPGTLESEEHSGGIRVRAGPRPPTAVPLD